MNSSLNAMQPPIKAGWITVLIAWACFLIPITGLSIVGLVFTNIAFIISIIVMVKGKISTGILQMLASSLGSGIFYLIGGWIWLYA